MSDYTELVKELRESVANKRLMIYAADAIEELSRMVDASIPKSDAEIIISEVAKVQPKWIPVTEKLPQGADDSGQLCENVLLQMSVEYNDNYVTSGWINGATKKVYYLDEKDDFIHKADMSVVKAWMPLPKPPKEETE